MTVLRFQPTERCGMLENYPQASHLPNRPYLWFFNPIHEAAWTEPWLFGPAPFDFCRFIGRPIYRLYPMLRHRERLTVLGVVWPKHIFWSVGSPSRHHKFAFGAAEAFTFIVWIETRIGRDFILFSDNGYIKRQTLAVEIGVAPGANHLIAFVYSPSGSSSGSSSSCRSSLRRSFSFVVTSRYSCLIRQRISFRKRAGVS